MSKKLIDFPDKVEEEIQEYADENFRGNFTATLLHLAIIALQSLKK